jgi:hypothetical protein
MAEVGGMEIKIGVILDDVAKKLKEAQKPFKELGEVLQSSGRNLTQMFTIPIAGAAAAVLAFSKEAKAAFGEFSAKVRESLGKVGDDLTKTINLKGGLDIVSNVVRSLGEAFIALPSPVKLAIITFASFVAAVGPAVLLLGKFITLSGTLQFIFHGPGGIILLLGAAAAAIVGVGSAFSGAADEAEEFGRKAEQAAAQEAVNSAKAKLAAARSGAATGGIAPPFEWMAPPGMKENMQKIFQDRIRRAEDELAAAQLKLSGPSGAIGGESNLGVNPQTAIWEKYSASIQQANLQAAIHGETVGVVQDKVQAATLALAEMKMRGYDETSNAVKVLNADLEENQAKLGTLTTGWTTFIDALRNLPSVAQQISSALMDVFTQFSQGVGNAIAQVLVYGESFKKLMTALLKQVLATVISTFVQMAIQYVVNAILSHVYAASVGAANIGTSIARAGAAAFAASVETFGIYGIAAGPGFAASAITGASAAALSGKAIGTAIGAAAAEGGIFTTPGLTSIAERGKPEMVLNDANIKRFFPGMAAGGTRPVIHTHVFMNSREIMEAITDEFRLQGLGA